MNTSPITLILGGARSGKSRHAEALALERFTRPLYIATAEVTDPEMASRIACHRARRGTRWTTREEPLDLAGTLLNAEPACDGVVIECLTTWLGNVLCKEDDAACTRRCAKLLDALHVSTRPVILIANEVGLGIVPATELGRRFRDLAGWLNQDIARLADTVLFIAAGLPLTLKCAHPPEHPTP